MKPKCMTPEDFVRWQFHNRRIVTINQTASTPCQDCTVEFASEMRDIDMCDGRPGRAAQPLPVHQEASRINRHRSMVANAERAYDLYMTGLSQTAVAAEMGISQSAVSKYIRMKRAEAA